MSDSDTTFPLTPVELHARNHALLCSIGFLILLPIGVLVPRYTRTLPYKWFHAHWPIQFVIAFPIILAGWCLGHQTSDLLESNHYQDPHQKIGLTLLILYCLQLSIGVFVHFFKFPDIFRGYRPPHSYFHVILGLAIIILAQYQVHYGLYIEWDNGTGGLHQVPNSAKHAWLALVVVFWALYILGMFFIPSQLKKENAATAERTKQTSKA